MQLTISRYYQTPLLTHTHPIAGTGPIKQAAQPPLPHKCRLPLHRHRIIITHKPTIPTHTVRRARPLVHALPRPGPRQVPKLERPFFAPVPGVCLGGAGGGQEGAAVAGDAEEDGLGRDAVGEAVCYGGAAAGGVGVGGVELGVVAGERGPRAGEVVGHEVEVG